MADFKGKRYVVTGAASGIGHAVAERLLAAARKCTAWTATARPLR